MDYYFQIMKQQQAETIAHSWHYDGIYSFYDIEADQEDFEAFIDPEQRGESTFAVYDDDNVIGYFSFNSVDASTVDIGLGMRPDLTGQGNGLAFIKTGMKYAQAHYTPQILTLSVATFNKRAIKVYKKAGFEAVGTFIQATNGSRFEFLKMAYNCY
ncbi:GNAT family N-acetyltransferase [Tuberibacillus sp. Marseille-P3662]|uniref:GNAT family N-acetyltransferase n=1 Tax=Tuberibacillus sp. Marseille-P3662 TaxID=1965358 RepID=UPI000A1C8CD3|nr:GNAT family protein [Tuberibacillus sp. Marseille-P3662]